MVKSGMDKRIVENKEYPRVSPYRLSAHLASAFTIYTTMLWTGLDILRSDKTDYSKVAPDLHGFD